MDKQTESEHLPKNGGWLQHFKPISNFIATHGLAVFLVVYYAVFLYPEAYRERAEWIQELTALRRAVAPETRPVSKVQAIVILDYATDLFFETLESELHYLLFKRRYSRGIGNSSWGSDEATIYIWGQKFVINRTKPLKPQAASLITRFKKLRGRGHPENIRIARLAIDSAVRKAQTTAYRLQSFNFDRGTLKDIWETSFRTSFRTFEDKVPNLYANEVQREYVEKTFLNFLEEHAQYTETFKHTVELESTETLISNFRKQVRQDWLSQLKSTKKYSIISSP